MSSLNIRNLPSVLANKPPLSIATLGEDAQCVVLLVPQAPEMVVLQQVTVQHRPWARHVFGAVHPEKSGLSVVLPSRVDRHNYDVCLEMRL